MNAILCSYECSEVNMVWDQLFNLAGMKDEKNWWIIPDENILAKLKFGQKTVMLKPILTWTSKENSIRNIGLWQQGLWWRANFREQIEHL